jgi:predicted DNA binding protein
MKENKNIDRLFQEQFRGFEDTPDNQVWLNIEAELKKDKKRKVIPLWLRCSGIAAAFLLGLFTLNMNQTFHSKTENRIVLDSKNSSIKKHINPQNSSKKTQNEVQIVGNSKENSKYKKEIINTDFSKSITKNEKDINPYGSSKVLVYQKKNTDNAEVFLPKSNLPLKQSATNENNNNLRSLNAEKNSFTNSNSLANATNQTIEKKDVKEKEESKKQVAINPESPNELEEILKAKSVKKNAVASNSKNKWQITPNVAPIYLNANSGGSPIDEQLSDYEKKSDKNVSFGIGVHYAVGKKIVVRTGINKVVLGYNTSNVLYSTGLTANNLRNIEYSSNNAVKFVNETNYGLLTTTEKEIQNTNTGSLNQKMGYYELPMEVSYAVLDKKFGINLIGGFSTLFLNENTISLVSPQSNIELGEAKNLNQVHFSSNVGLGFKYQITKSFQINVEPMVKYQLNTFSNNSGDYKPLFIGLYSGISYGF